MPPRPHMRSIALAVRSRPQTSTTWSRPWLHTTRYYADDSSKLHPNPKVVPSTDPSLPRASANPERADSVGDPEAQRSRTGHLSPNAQNNLDQKGPNMDQLPHVSEEAAAMSKSMGSEGPDLSQGTPVGDIVKDDEEAQANLPKVMQDAMKKNASNQKRSFTTSIRRLRPDALSNTSSYSEPSPGDLSFPSLRGNPSNMTGPAGAPANREDQDYPGQYYEINDEEAMLIARGLVQHPDVGRPEAQHEAQQRQGLKFGELKDGGRKMRHLRRRYEGVVEQVTNMIMRHGMKSKAQRNMAEILTYLRTAPAPQTSSQRRLLALPAHTPTPAHLPLNPTHYLTHALDSVSPLLRLRSQRGLTGGGVALSLPVPLTLRQRRRTAIVWILDAVEKRKGGASGFAKRFAEEIVSVVEGKSSVWTKREGLQRQGVLGRSNLGLVRGGRR